ncbi:hypothetical protein [Tardiphaga sp. 709]|uniref:hypothetical protein n=1 Tax=Tardiphaga sp. 709 TaxID=3076039 RepID=UPI0028E40059|nr:hypothetical protein [Tardiphaga sp. 709]WNV09970.1 hypothetical protein RSO67_01875 [Tardiphaga sp. 709]
MTTPSTGDAMGESPVSEKIIRAVATAIYNDDFDGIPEQAFEDRDLDIIGAYITNARAAIEAYRKAMREER